MQQQILESSSASADASGSQYSERFRFGTSLTDAGIGDPL